MVLQGVKDHGIGGNSAPDRRPGMLHGASSPRYPCRSVTAAPCQWHIWSMCTPVC